MKEGYVIKEQEKAHFITLLILLKVGRLCAAGETLRSRGIYGVMLEYGRGSNYSNQILKLLAGIIKTIFAALAVSP